jgi:hypothetical protein
MEELLSSVHAERRCFLAMKGTESKKTGAGSLELNAFANNLNYIGAFFYQSRDIVP